MYDYMDGYITGEVMMILCKGGILAFFFILFAQAGMDKIVNRRENLEWLKDHFKHSVIRYAIKQALHGLIVLEMLTALFCGGGAIGYLIYDYRPLGAIGLFLAMFTLLSLFLGQRAAKDYPGAASLTGYFIINILGLYLLSFE